MAKTTSLPKPSASNIKEYVSLIYENYYNDDRGAGLLFVGTVRKTLTSKYNFNATLSNKDIYKALKGSDFIMIPTNGDSFCIGYPELLSRNFYESLTEGEHMDKQLDWKEIKNLIEEEFLSLKKEERELFPELIDKVVDKVMFNYKDDSIYDYAERIDKIAEEIYNKMKKELKESVQTADIELTDDDYVFDEESGDIHVRDEVIHYHPKYKKYIDVKFTDDNDEKIYTYKLVEYDPQEINYPCTLEYIGEAEDVAHE